MTTIYPPNQIQLEVEVNTENNNNQYSGQQSQLPDPEARQETAEPKEDDDAEKKANSCLSYMAFLCVILMFMWPFMLQFINYYTDYNLWTFMKLTSKSYKDARSVIKNDNSIITTITCKWDNENSLESFEYFMAKNTSQSATGCSCNTYSGTDTGGIDCDIINV